MRVQGWEKKLDAYVREVAEKPFRWGDCDCLIFVSDACLISCEKDPMSYAVEGDPETIRGRYDTKEKAYDLIKELRGSIRNVMDTHFNRVNPNFAQRGDVVLAKLDDGYTFGLVWGGKALFKSEKYFTSIALSDCRYAWRVE